MAAALVAATFTLPGCLLAVGSSSSASDRRLERLEERMRRAEERLGIPPQEASQ
jgi:DNA-binding IclR family transcriptional regulator